MPVFYEAITCSLTTEYKFVSMDEIYGEINEMRNVNIHDFLLRSNYKYNFFRIYLVAKE